MKTTKYLLFIPLLFLVIMSCNDKQPEVKTVDVNVTNKDVAKKLDPNATYAKVEFGIDGMTCAMGCAKTIEKKMAKLEGVKTATVDFDKRIAMVEYDEAKVTPESLKYVVSKVGDGDVYKVKDMKLVEEFGASANTCKADCKMACCADEKNKKPCAEDCKMECCSDKKKSE